MPIHRDIDPVGRVVRTRVVDPLTVADIRKHAAAVRRSGCHDHLEMIDARAAGPVQLSIRDVLDMAHQARTSVGPQTMGRRALVVANDDNYRLGRVFAAIVVGWLRIGVFDDPAAAEAWLTSL